MRDHSGGTGRIGSRGFTLLEMVIALTIAFIALGSIAYFLRHSTKQFSTMENQTEVSEGSYQALSKITNDLMQAGADLPQLDTTVLVGRIDSIAVWANPRAAYVPVTKDTTNDSLWVKDARPLKGLTSVRHFIYSPTSPQWQTRTLVSVDTVRHILVFSSNATFTRADVLYDRVLASYYLDRSLKQVMYKPATGNADPIAENVDDLKFYFKDKLGNSTVQWADMKTCSVCVTVHPPAAPQKRSTACRRFFFRNRSASM